jgi:aldose 1-epimerase
MLTLAGGGWAAVLLPAEGAAMAALRRDGQEVLVPLPAGADPKASFAGAFLMLPWTNRMDGGRLGGFGTVPVNRPADGTAIHGLARGLPFVVEAAGPDRAVLTQSAAAGPYAWRARFAVVLGAAVEITLSVENAGAAPMPFGIGWHPFFAAPAGMVLAFAARARLRTDPRMLPLAAEPSAGVAGADYAGLDTHFTGWDGRARLGALVLEATGAWAGNLQVFSPPGSGFVCLEPVSHVPDAPNRPALGEMAVLAPGEGLAGRLRIGVG